MDLVIVEFWVLFAIATFFQVAAIAVRKLLLSLFFSFLYSVTISLILIAMGHMWLALTNLWLASGLTYFGLTKTALLIGTHAQQKPQRRITVSLFVFILVVSTFTLIAALIAPELQELELVDSSFKSSGSPMLTGDQGILILILAMMALSSLISVFLLVREDDHPLKH